MVSPAFYKILNRGRIEVQDISNKQEVKERGCLVCDHFPNIGANVADDARVFFTY